MKSKKQEIALHKKVLCKIRYYQQLHDLSNKDLADLIGVSEQTLLKNDKKRRK